MNQPKSSSVPKIAGILVAVIVAGSLFIALRPKHPVSSNPTLTNTWDRRVTVSGDAGTKFQYWLNRGDTSEFRDLQVPIVIEVTVGIHSIEIRHTDASGRIELKVQSQKGETAAASLSAKDQYASLMIDENQLVWSSNVAGELKTVSHLDL